MKILVYLPEIEAELERLGGSLDASIHHLLACLESDGSNEADFACQVFSNTGSWPLLEPRVRLEVCLRLACAAWYCRDNSEQEREDETRSEFLESLLVEYWNDVGKTDWLYESFVLPATEKKTQRPRGDVSSSGDN